MKKPAKPARGRGRPKKSATATKCLASQPEEESDIEIDIECPTSRGLIVRTTVCSAIGWWGFRDAVACKMNHHVQNIEIGYKLSIDDSKQGTRQLECTEDFESMICMLRQQHGSSRTRPITVVIIDLAVALGNVQQLMACGRVSKVCLYYNLLYLVHNGPCHTRPHSCRPPPLQQNRLMMHQTVLRDLQGQNACTLTTNATSVHRQLEFLQICAVGSTPPLHDTITSL